MKKYDILAVGGVYVDIVCTGMPFDEAGMPIEKETVGSSYEMVLGGSPLNFERLCAQLGLMPVIVGKVGADEPGRLIEKMSREAGIFPALAVDPNLATNIGMNFVNPDGQVVMTVAGSANQHLSVTDVLEKAEPLLHEVKYLYLGSCLKLKRLLPAYEELAERAKATDTKIVVDHGRVNGGTTPADRELVKALVQHSDYYLPSRGEFLEMWGVETIEAGLTGINWGHTTVVVKDGADGAYALVKGKVAHVPAFPAKPVNTVGAGDSFNAALITAIAEGQPLEAAMRFACATAALKISNPGLPTRDMIDALINVPEA